MSQNLIHAIKYRGQIRLAQYLGRHFARRLVACDHFSEFDLVIPVPLHPRKQRQRGYNQSEAIARGMAAELSIPIRTDIVCRQRSTTGQTDKGRMERWHALEDAFLCIRPEVLVDRRVLLVDDVITTGATLISLGQCLQKIPGLALTACSLVYLD